VTGLAEQYAWFVDYDGSDSYCLSVIKGRSPEEVLHLLGGDRARVLPNMDAVWQETQETEETEGIIAALAVEGWVLLFEPDGYRGVRRKVAERLSRGTQLVSHHRSVNMDTTFLWAENGIVQAEFELQSPWEIVGAKAGQVKSMLSEAGFADTDSADSTASSVYLPAALALSEILTGLRITRNLLGDSQYMCATVPV
jgi:hypothetical protein